MKNPLILVCNSHIDPVWLWEWEEGLAETLSTFRTAVRFCEKYNDFVFCHNESLLYEWVEKYEPSLFDRIVSLVKKGKWCIMGGWYVQPDCNMLLGESVVRQIITGKKYFLEKFGKEPSTAINFDSFGHSRGLVQILTAAGYDSYLFCRPDNKYLDLPGDTFLWQGFDGSTVMAHRAAEHYNSQSGLAGEKIRDWIANSLNMKKKAGVLLWGIGNHGGGPSENDIEGIEKIKNKEKTWNIIQGTPEEYFSIIKKEPEKFAVFKGGLNPFAIGCYTSMKTVKQALYRLEHKFYSAEKLLSLAAVSGNLKYPFAKMEEALKELLFCQFHDILPGSSVEPVEKNVLHRIGYANMIIENETASLYVNIGNCLKPAIPEEFPLMLVNPHPFDIDEIVELELQLPEPNFDKSKIRIPQIFNEKGESIPVQCEKPQCNIKDDHRKKVVFRVKINAGSVVRYSCFLKDVPKETYKKTASEELNFNSEGSRLVIDKSSGFPELWKYKDSKLLGAEQMRFAVINDNADPWGMSIKSFDGEADFFKLMTCSQVFEFAGLTEEKLNPVYISENGEIRTIAESLFTYNSSKIHLKYFVPVNQPGFDVEITVYWMEKDKLLKWIIPVGYNMSCVGRSISGIDCLKQQGREFVFRDWLGIKNYDGENTFSICADGAYGFDIRGNNIGISLLRSPAYSGHPVEGEKDIVMTDRAIKRIDQGVHTFRFRLTPGNTDEIIDRSFNHSDLFNNPVISRVVYPTGKGNFTHSGIKVSDTTINLQSVKLNDNGDLVIRLLNPCKELKQFKVAVPSIIAEADLEIGPKKLKTWSINRITGEFKETDLLERNIRQNL